MIPGATWDEVFGYSLPMVPIDVLGLDSDSFLALVKRHLPRRLQEAGKAYGRAFSAEEAGNPFDAWVDGAGRAPFSLGLLPVRETVWEEGAAGRTTKIAFLLTDGATVEAVSIPMYGDTRTLCVSSQVGCARACAFCQTGRAGLSRNLSAAEIVAQVVSAGRLEGHRFRNIVFMGMGEPLDNLDSVAQALTILGDRRGLAYSYERITLCTAGVADRIAALGALGFRRLNVSISLNAARDELRNSLMPVNLRHPLAELASALKAYPRRSNFYFALNYCLLPGINDSAGDAASVADFAREVGKCIVNLIPYNPGREPLTRAPTEEEVASFSAALSGLGVPVRVRVEKGRGAMAACGQLGASRDSRS